MFRMKLTYYYHFVKDLTRVLNSSLKIDLSKLIPYIINILLTSCVDVVVSYQKTFLNLPGCRSKVT